MALLPRLSVRLSALPQGTHKLRRVGLLFPPALFALLPAFLHVPIYLLPILQVIKNRRVNLLQGKSGVPKDNFLRTGTL